MATAMTTEQYSQRIDEIGALLKDEPDAAAEKMKALQTDIKEILGAVAAGEERKEELERMRTEFEAANERLTGWLNEVPPENRKAVLDPREAAYDRAPAAFKDMRELVREPIVDDKIERVQELNDRCYMAATILGKDPRDLNLYQALRASVEVYDSPLAKALYSSGTGVGVEWVPTEMGARLFRSIRIPCTVEDYFEHITLPTPTYESPLEGADLTAYLVAEPTADEGAKITATTYGTSKMTFGAKSFAVRTKWSRRVDEASIVPILGHAEEKMALALREGRENALIAGDASATHQDSDVTNPQDVRKMRNGIRKNTQAALVNDLSTLTVENYVAALAEMGKYMLDPTKIIVIVGPKSLSKVMVMKDAGNNLIYMTWDKAQALAINMRGTLGSLLGSPVVPSAFVRQDLNNTGVYDASTVDKTELIVVRTDAYLIGDMNTITLEREKDIETQQWILVGTLDWDFQPTVAVATEAISMCGVKIS